MAKSFADRSADELNAGESFRQSLVPRADEIRHSAPLWHGWALMEAFLAGVDYGRKNSERKK